MTTSQTPPLLPPFSFMRKTGPAATENERVVLGMLLQCGGTSRTVLARRTALTTQSISRLVGALEERGLVRFGEKLSARGNGTSGHAVELVADAAFTLGISLMTDAISLAVMNFTGQVLEARYEPQPHMSRDAVLSRAEAIATDLLEKHVYDRTRLLGAGLAISGYFVDGSRRVNAPAALEEFALVDLGGMLGHRLGTKVIVENDGTAAAIAERMLGHGRDYSDFGYIHFDTGIGGGLILRGQSFRGSLGNAGELAGIVPIEQFDDRPTLDLLLRMVREAGVEVASISDLAERFDLSWPGVEAWIARVRRPLNAIVSALASVVDPQAIILGGRMPSALGTRIIEEIEVYSVPRRQAARPEPKFLPAAVRKDPAVIGAAALPLTEHFF